MSKWVHWSQWGECGMIDAGQMPVRDVQKHLQRFETEAADLLETSGADHVVYATKEYNGEELDNVKFYLLPMTEKKFEERVASLKNIVVYALHRRTKSPSLDNASRRC